jgi:hypothetical protein
MVSLAMWTWLALSLWSIPIPVRATGHLGKPIIVRKGETAKELSKRIREGLQEMIDGVREDAKRGRSYRFGMRRQSHKIE